jgi:hypothetical protein
LAAGLAGALAAGLAGALAATPFFTLAVFGSFELLLACGALGTLTLGFTVGFLEGVLDEDMENKYA